MCRTCGKRHNSLIQDGSPGTLPQDAGSLDSSESSSIPLSCGVRSPGKVSPLRGCTMKEYDEQLAALRKENFALKLRIYFLEDRVGQKGDKEDKEQLYRTNIELKVETEALKQEVYNKQELVREASDAMVALEQNYQHQLQALQDHHTQEISSLHHTIDSLQKEVEEYEERLREQEANGGQLGQLTQLCSLAFPSADEDTPQPAGHPEGEGAAIWEELIGDLSGYREEEEEEREREEREAGDAIKWGSDTKMKIPTTPLSLTPHPQATSPTLSLYSCGMSSPANLQGLFSLQEPPSEVSLPPVPPTTTITRPTTHSTMHQQGQEEVVSLLRRRVQELEEKVQDLEGQLVQKEEIKTILEGDLKNLKHEMDEKVERVVELEGEMVEREERLEEVMQELESRHSQLQDKDHQISSLHDDLNRVQPEMEVKVQEIVERDRIIEEKIEQIEHQNKILVEIQITLDERQKQLADMETRLAEAEERATQEAGRADKLALDLEKSCKVIQTFAEEVQVRDKEIAGLRKEVKRREKKNRDLVAELKEALDMLNKAKWEAETSGGEDGVKEMAEEENERLWAEVEARKKEVVTVRAAAEAAEERAQSLAAEVAALTAQRDQVASEAAAHRSQLTEVQTQLQQVQAEALQREGQLATAKTQAEGLEIQLSEARTQLEQKRQRLATLEEDLKATRDGELDRQALQVDRLQNQLATLAAQPPPTHTTTTHLHTLTESPQPAPGKVDLVSLTQVAVPGATPEALQHLHQEVGRVRGEVEVLREERSHLTHQLASLHALLPQNTPAPTAPISNLTTPTPAPTAPTSNLSAPTPALTALTPAITTPTPTLTAQSPAITAPTSALTTLTPALTTPTPALTAPTPALTTPTPTPTYIPPTVPSSIGKDLLQNISSGGEERPGMESEHEDSAVEWMCQTQLEGLKTDLEEAQRVGEELGRTAVDQVVWLQQRLQESHTACRLLRCRLEELASFLQSILELEERGLISLDSLPSSQMAALHRSLNQSRALSQSLLATSQTTDDVNISALLADLGQDEEGVSLDTMLGTTLSSSMWLGREGGEEQAQALQALAAQLGTHLSHKSHDLDTIASCFSDLSHRLASRTTQVQHQAALISQLQGTMAQLAAQPASNDLSTQDSGHSSDPLPPPPLHLLQDSECEVGPGQAGPGSEPSSFGAIKSAYSTDAAIKAHSGRLAQQQLQQEGPVESGVGGGEMWVGSLSESEAWSEPDRNVSLARIGLHSTTLTSNPDRPTPRPRLPRTSALTSESEGEAQLNDPLPAQPTPKAGKRKSDLAELRRVSNRLKAVEQLGDTLRAELHLYHTFIHQLHPQALVSTTTTDTLHLPTNATNSTATSSMLTIDEAPSPTSTHVLTPTTNTAPPDSIPSVSILNHTAPPDSLPSVSTLNHTVPLAKTDIHTLPSVSTLNHTAPPESIPSVSTLNHTVPLATTDIHTLPSVSTLNHTIPCDSTPISTIATHTAPLYGTPSINTMRGMEVDVAVVAAPLLAEVRALRDTLEEAITNNNHLRDQLEAALLAHPDEEARFLHLTAALQSAQEEVHEAREQFSAAQTLVEEAQKEAVQARREADEVRARLQQETTDLDTARQEVEKIKQQTQDSLKEAQQAKMDMQEAKYQVEEADRIGQESLNKREEAERKVSESKERVKMAETETQEAKKLAEIAEKETQEAKKAAEIAEKEIQEARRAAETAEKETQEARKAAETAEKETQEARKAAETAEKETQEARKAAETAEKETQEARKAAETAEKEMQEAKKLAEVAEKESLESKKLLEITEREIIEAKKFAETAEKQSQEAKKQAEAEGAKLRSEVEAAREEVDQAREAAERRQGELEAEVRRVYTRITTLEEEVQRLEAEAAERERKVEEKERRLLEVNKERLALVGERTRLQARLTTQLQDARRADEEKEQLVEEKKRIQGEKEELEEDRKRLLEENQLLEVEREQGRKLEVEARRQLEVEKQVSEVLQQRLDNLMVTHSLNSTSTSPSPSEHLVLAGGSDASQESVTSLEYFPHQGQWESRATLSPTPLPPPPHLLHTPDTSDAVLGRNSVLGGNKMEKEREVNRREREHSANKRLERDTSVTKKDRESSAKRSLTSSSHWSEDKENLYISATEVMNNTTISSSNNTVKRNRRAHDSSSSSSSGRGCGGGILAPSAHHRSLEDNDGFCHDMYGERESTSGESPDLGIGSDHQFSSLERGVTISKHHNSLMPHSPPSLPTQLCSEPSHSILGEENERLRCERDKLAAQLTSTMTTLQETHERLSRANQRKETVERAICKQLNKTHHVLKRANAHIKQAGALPQ